MTPDMPARSLSLTRRTEAIERMVRETIDVGAARSRQHHRSARGANIVLCYPDDDPKRPQFRGIAKEMIERRREQKTLRALDDLIAHLGTLRDERKFVVLLSEGWVLFRQNERPGRGPRAGLDAVAAAASAPSTARSPGGTATMNAYDRGFASCERERSMLAFVDHSLELRQLAQRANRANVTFYVVDPRGLAPFDDSIGPMRPATPDAGSRADGGAAGRPARARRSIPTARWCSTPTT